MKSFLNCHAKGLHSLSVGRTDDGKMIRMFIAEEHHTLWQNSVCNFKKGVQSLSFHNHKTDISIVPLTGIIHNISLVRDTSERSITFDEYLYRSIIVNSDDGRFEKTGKSIDMGVLRSKISEPIMLDANTLHTISVPRNTKASWLIFEGEPLDKGNEFLSYSVADLSDWSASGLYLKPSDCEVETLKKQFLFGACKYYFY